MDFSEKEAGVYLALLELGSATVAPLAKKAGVNRTTAYEILEALIEKGFVSKSDVKNVTTYVAESPARFESLIRKEEQDVAHRKKRLEETMPQLFALYNAMEDKPGVRFFEGEEGIAAAREVMTSSGGTILTFAAYDEGAIRMAQIAEEQRVKFSRRIRGRAVFAMKPGITVRPIDAKNWEVRRIPYERYPFTGEINIINGKVGAFVFKTKPLAFIIESREIADVFRILFEMAWLNAKPVDLQSVFKK